MNWPHSWHLCRAFVVAVCALALSGCFDLTQKISIGRGGSGRYEIAVTANGLLGEALKQNKSGINLKHNRARTHTAVKDGHVTQTAVIDFKSLSDLHLSDESLSLTNRGASWFGLGPSHLSFRRTFLVDRARRENMRGQSQNDRLGAEMLQTMFGDHTYVYSLTVPGSVECANPVRIGGMTIKPQVSGSGLSHTVTWKMPLTTMLQAKLIKFEVDFSAYGPFPDAQSLPD